MQRRDLLKLALTAALAGPVFGKGDDEVESQLGEIEAQSGGRLGVHIRFPDGSEAGHRSDERFAMCSTFKLPLAALILREVDAGNLHLDQSITFTEDDLVPYAPVIEKNLGRGEMTIGELARAAQTSGDNVAANLLLGLIDGPAGFTERLRKLGDDVTRLDRTEPTMNFVPANEVRDTTTPRAMASLVEVILFDSFLAPDSQARLRGWLEATTTGKRRLKAGLPSTWRIGNKTGTGIAPGMANKYNDVAIAWPGAVGEAVIIAAFFEADGEYPRIRQEDEAVLRRVADLTTAHL